jgi:transcriptional regulator with XRE-family HTH domain
MRFGEFLKLRRGLVDLSIRHAVMKTGIPLERLNSLEQETSNRPPTYEEFLKISDTYKITLFDCDPYTVDEEKVKYFAALEKLISENDKTKLLEMGIWVCEVVDETEKD